MRTFGKYRLVEPLASGGMADVWRAEVSGAEGVVKEVALKLVRGEHAARSDFVRMFVEEARLAARLGHANVVQVFEFDEVDGRYYIAMELVRGRHLGQVVERAREEGVRLGVPRAVHVAAEVARGLAHAHRLSEGGRPLGLVHRDVSPHNVLVSFEGEVKLADFGIARAIGRAGITAPGTLKGKVAYMAPEQGRGADVDARADVFALGVVLWELCAGRRLFLRDSEAATLAAVLSEEPISPPSAWNEAVPPELDAAVMGALERDPSRRTRSAEELGAALAGILLRVTRSPDEVDLRAFMARIFPAGASEGVAEATRVRAPVAAERVAGETRVAPAAPGGLEATRTATAPSRPTGRRLLAAGGLALALALAGVGAAAMAGKGWPGGERAPATAAATSTRTEPAPPPATASRSATATPTPPEPAIPTATPPETEIETATSSETSTSTDAAPATPPDSPSVPPALPLTPLPAELVARGPLYAIPAPPRSSGKGVLSVNATPWGRVIVNGRDVGETPLDVELPAGRYRVRVQNPRSIPEERTVAIQAGRREPWLVRLRAR